MKKNTNYLLVLAVLLFIGGCFSELTLGDIVLNERATNIASSINRVEIFFNLPDGLGNYTGSQPVTFGIPFEREELNNGDGIRVVDIGGNQISAQFEVTATWTENSTDVRWLLVDFLVSITNGDVQRTFLEYGPLSPSVTVEPRGSLIAPSKVFTKIFNIIQRAIKITIFPSGVENLNEITFQTTKDLQNQKITIEKVTSAPASSTRVFHSFFKVEAGEIGRNLETAEVSFHVEKEWLSERKLSNLDVALFHWDGSLWNELPTKYVSEDRINYNYVATTNSFSYFAIGVKEKEVLEEINETTPRKIGKLPLVGRAAEQEIPIGDDYTFYWMVSLMVLVLSLIVFLVYRQRRKLRRFWKTHRRSKARKKIYRKVFKLFSKK